VIKSVRICPQELRSRIPCPVRLESVVIERRKFVSPQSLRHLLQERISQQSPALAMTHPHNVWQMQHDIHGENLVRFPVANPLFKPMYRIPTHEYDKNMRK
jgi:hypothetical protein